MKKVLVFLGLSMAMFYPLSSSAYKFTEDFIEGYYWASFPITMSKFVTNPSDGMLLEQLVNEAEEEWESGIGVEVWNLNSNYIISGNYTGNFIRWSDNFAAETGYDSSSTLAVTIRYTEDTYIYKTVIILNGGFPGLRSNSSNLLKKTILHELGHTIGIAHSDRIAIMATYISGVNSLQSDDIEAGVTVVNETIHRQEIGFVAAAARENFTENAWKFGSCGTIMLSKKNNILFSNIGINFFISLLVGLLIIPLGKFCRR